MSTADLARRIDEVRERAYPGREAALFSEAHRAFNRMMAATP